MEKTENEETEKLQSPLDVALNTQEYLHERFGKRYMSTAGTFSCPPFGSGWVCDDSRSSD